MLTCDQAIFFGGARERDMLEALVGRGRKKKRTAAFLVSCSRSPEKKNARSQVTKMSKMGILKSILKSVFQILKKICLKNDIDVCLKVSKIEHMSYG